MKNVIGVSVDEENKEYFVTLCDGGILRGLDKLNQCHIFKEGNKFVLRHMTQKDWDRAKKKKKVDNAAE